MTSMPAARAASSTAAIGFTARASWLTSLPSVSPKPPGSMKSRCMSMMRSAVAAQSSTIGPGSAASFAEFAMTYAPRTRELFGRSQARPMPLCTMAAGVGRPRNRSFFQFVEYQRCGDTFSVRRFPDVHLLTNWAAEAENSRSAAATPARPQRRRRRRRHAQDPSSSEILRGPKIRLVPDDCYELIPIQQRSAKCPLPDRQETGKPGVRDGSLIGPRAVFEAFFRQQFLISAVRFGGGTDVPQYVASAGTVLVGAGTFIVVQHAIGELDVERRPAGTPLVGRRRNLVDHLVLRIIRRYQEVRCTRDSKPRLAKYQIRRRSE